MGNQASFELEQPGAKRYVCGSCGANASTKLYVCGHCKVTRYCSAAHQKNDKKNHVGKVCNDLKKSRKQYRKQKHNKGKNVCPGIIFQVLLDEKSHVLSL